MPGGGVDNSVGCCVMVRILAALTFPLRMLARWVFAAARPIRPAPGRYGRRMLAATATSFDSGDPLRGLRVGSVRNPSPPEGWVVVQVKAAALNQHDLWSLRGVGLAAAQLPRILGCDAAGIDAEGKEVVVHAVIGDASAGRGDPTMDPNRSLLSEKYDGTLAEFVAVPAANLVPKPTQLSFKEAACLPTAWLTAYRMLLTNSATAVGDTVLVQGAGGGVSTALIMLSKAAGRRVWVTSRSAERRERALALGADEAFESGARLPERVDAVFDSVGAATWAHSLRCLRPGGTIVTCGATSGDAPSAELNRVFFQQLRIIGSTMGTRDELVGLLDFLVASGLRPVVDRVLPLAAAQEGFAALLAGDVFGKVVFTV
jgi:NADPH:quinone reductase-like Zn-dependent oxidoreductase